MKLTDLLKLFIFFTQELGSEWNRWFVDDPDVVECKVDGSVFVLKTSFLKKE